MTIMKSMMIETKNFFLKLHLNNINTQGLHVLGIIWGH